jgi:predicted Zn finger-like uncharacterized protein
MAQTWQTSNSEGHTCPHCEAQYSVKKTHLPQREKDTATCEKCGKELAAWDDTFTPHFTLKAGK